MASHVSTKERYEYLCTCLRTIDAQQDPVDAFYFSWSAAPEYVAAIETQLGELKHAIRNLHQRSRRLSQYEHLREAVRAAKSDNVGLDAWCCFCDDDDLWHPQRAAMYRAASAAQEDSVTGLSLGVYVQPTVAELEHDPTSADEVDSMLRRGLAKLHYARGSEVFLLAVRLSLLSAFLESAPDQLLQNKFADTRFASHVVRELELTTVHVEPRMLVALAGGRSDCWMYYYRKPPSSESDGDDNEVDNSIVGEDVRASDSITPDEEDVTLVRDLLPPGSPAEVVQPMIVGAAALRHTVEMCVLLCLHLRNAGELAVEVVHRMQPELSMDPVSVRQGSPARVICERIASQALRKFGHRGAELPQGKVEDVWENRGR